MYDPCRASILAKPGKSRARVLTLWLQYVRWCRKWHHTLRLIPCTTEFTRHLKSSWLLSMETCMSCFRYQLYLHLYVDSYIKKQHVAFFRCRELSCKIVAKSGINWYESMKTKFFNYRMINKIYVFMQIMFAFTSAHFHICYI